MDKVRGFEALVKRKLALKKEQEESGSMVNEIRAFWKSGGQGLFQEDFFKAFYSSGGQELASKKEREELMRLFHSKQRRARDFRLPSWTQGECLGTGNFGKVYKCVTCDDEIYAVKIVKMEPQYTKAQEEVKALNNEIEILKRITHERIVSYYGSQQKDGHLHLFMDFMAGGSLSAYIKNCGVLSEDESQRYTNQMLQGIEFLHSLHVIHRDIKGSNVLLDGEGNVKLADFGLSKIIQKVGTKTNLVSHCGTPYWMAPEIFWGEGYGRKADIWSLGCTVVEMLTGKPPLGDLKPAAAIYWIGSRPTEPTLPETASQDAKEFIMAALTWKPKERPWSNDLQCYKFISKSAQPMSAVAGVSSDWQRETEADPDVDSAQPMSAVAGVSSDWQRETEADPDVDSAQPMSAVAGVSSDCQGETEADPDVDRNPGHRRRPVSWRMFPGYLPNHSREEYV